MGNISMPNGIIIGYLMQDLDFEDGRTVLEETQTAFEYLNDIEKKMNHANQQLSDRTDYESKEYLDIITEFNYLEERFRMSGGHDTAAEINQVLTGLGFAQYDFNRQTTEFSGGWRMRIELAKILLKKPDLLLLDEPFSNIDQSLKEEIQYSVKKLLKKINLTTIIVTHDSYEAFSLADRCGIILNQELKQYDVPYNVHHEPNSLEVAKFLNKGVFVDVEVLTNDCAVHTLQHNELGEIRGKLLKNYPKGKNVKLLLQPEDLVHDDQSKLKLEVVDRKFRGTNFIYTLKTQKGEHIPVFVHSHHIHQHEKSEKFGIKTPIFIDHLVCF